MVAILQLTAQFTDDIFEIGHPCYGQLTPVKTRYLLTSTMRSCMSWAQVESSSSSAVFFKVDR